MMPPEISAADLNAQLDRAGAWRASPHTPERLAAVNELALEYYQDRYRGSWAEPDRADADRAGHRRPGRPGRTRSY